MSFDPFPEAFYESSEYKEEFARARTRRLSAYYSADQLCETCCHQEWLHAPKCVASAECLCSSFAETSAIKGRRAHRAN